MDERLLRATVGSGTTSRTEDGRAREHVLLTVLGKDPKPARYSLEGGEAEASIAPIALVELLPDVSRPDRVLALCTPEARRTSWPLLERALATRCSVEAVDVPGGATQEDIGGFVRTLARSVPDDVDLTVDVTHGFRHFSFLTYIAVLYLAALRGVTIRGAYYGMLNREPELSPFLDLRPLLELPRWVHALKVLHETGSALPMAEIIETGPVDNSARDAARDLKQVSEAYLSGLPLELGRQAREFRWSRPRSLRKLVRRTHRLPLADELVSRLTELLEPFELTESVSGRGWKQHVALSNDELKRQARVIDDLLGRGSFATALGLMSEWTISWVAWVRGTGKDWLDYKKVRRSAGGLLNAMRAAERSELCAMLNKDQRDLGRFWGRLADLRNGYAHHGMRPQLLVGDKQIARSLEEVRSYWKGTLRSLPRFSLRLGHARRGRVLVSPIGLRPGVLFSALHSCRADGDGVDPASCLVICSQETEEMIAEAVNRAGYFGGVERVILEDALGGGSTEINRLSKAARGHFLGATDVCVNVTGGTTLMGLVAEQLATEARKLACPVRRFGLIDRRLPNEQMADPYQAGEAFWLDEGEVGGVN